MKVKVGQIWKYNDKGVFKIVSIIRHPILFNLRKVTFKILVGCGSYKKGRTDWWTESGFEKPGVKLDESYVVEEILKHYEG